MLVRKRGENQLIAARKSKNNFFKSKHFSIDSNNKNPDRGEYNYPGPFRPMKHQKDKGFIMKKSGIPIRIGTWPYNKPQRLILIEVCDGPVK